MKKYLFNWFTITILISFLLFFPSFNTYFTNDDFYFLNISKASSFSEFLQFFNPFVKHDGQAMYRPLTTETFYLIGNIFLNKNPFYMHILVFIFFSILIFLVYELSKNLFKNKNVAILTAFLYATSATHFGHLYYLATFQEIGAGIFILMTILTFLNKKYFFSALSLVLGLLSKESAVITVPLLMLVLVYLKKFDFIKLIPHMTILIIYLFIRLKFYGIAEGESYIWDFSGKVFNTLSWYGLWSLNIPESFVDFVGPGMNLNPNLFLFWRNTTVIIFSSFFMLLILISRKIFRLKFKFLLFNILFFILSLTPVLFLPFHKFSYYLTLSLFAVASVIAFAVRKSGRVTGLLIICMWIVGSVTALSFTRDTHWIKKGAEISLRVKEYFDKNNIVGDVMFIDTDKDIGLPWSPRVVVYNALSGQDFFDVYYQGKIVLSNKGREIEARQFLGY